MALDPVISDPVKAEFIVTTDSTLGANHSHLLNKAYITIPPKENP